MSTFNVLITGTKAGIGNGLLAGYVTRPNTCVIAAIRDAPESEVAKSMIASAATLGKGSSIIAVQYDAAIENSAQNLVKYLHEVASNITHLDCVIANAGIATHWQSCTEVTPEQLKNHYAVNTIGPIMLYQATRELLLASSTAPKFFVISSVVGSVQLGPGIGFQLPAYGTSKAAVNWFMRKANTDEERIILAAISPGWVQSEMGNRAAGFLKQEQAPMTLDDCVTALLKLFDTTDKEASKGLFLNYNGDGIPW